MADFSIRRPVAIWVVTLSIILAGLSSFFKLGVDLFPNVDIPIVAVKTLYPGADTDIVESRVTKILEDAVSGIGGMKHLYSVSSDSVSILTCEFELGVDFDIAAQDVRDRISEAVGQLPEGAEIPVVSKFDMDSQAIMSFFVTGNIDSVAFGDLVEKRIKDRISGLPGVGGVNMVGRQERQIEILLDRGHLQAYGLSADDVAMALKVHPVKIPSGRLQALDREYGFYLDGEYDDPQALADIVVSDRGGRVIRLGDVAKVRDGAEEARSFAMLNGKPGILVEVRKQSGTNTVALAASVHKAMDQVRQELPQGIEIFDASDISVFVKRSIDEVFFTLGIGALLTILTIFAFLGDGRATFVAALALPAAIIGVYFPIEMAGFTLNNMTTLALSLSVGLLIDDAIVVLENIYRHKAMGKAPRVAASEAVSEIGFAVIATTAAIVAVFIPVAFMAGMVGQFFREFGLTVAMAVGISLLMSLTLTPMLASRVLGDEPTNRWAKMMGKIHHTAAERYRTLIGWALRHRIITMAIAGAAFMATFAILPMVPSEFLPPQDKGQFNVEVQLAPGTPPQETQRVVEGVQAAIGSIHGIAYTAASIGSDARGQVEMAKIYVKLTDAMLEPRDSQDLIMDQVRKAIPQLPPGGKSSVMLIGDVDAGGSQAPVQYVLTGPDLDELAATSAKIRKVMEQSGGMVDIDTNLSDPRPEIRFVPNRLALADAGIGEAQLGQTLRWLNAGADVITQYREKGELADIVMRLKPEDRRDPAQLTAMNIRTPDGRLIPIANLVTVVHGDGPTVINRTDRSRSILMTANLAPGYPLGDAIKVVKDKEKELLPPGVQGKFAGFAEMMEETAINMGLTGLAIVSVIYLVLAFQFESFLYPLTIMMSIPMALVGAVGFIFVTGYSLNIFTMIGIMLLMGLVAKNAILLVDYTNTLRHEGKERNAALIEAGAVRLRPILMTTLAMIAGMLPIALGAGPGAETRAPMAVAVIGGLVTSTLLTLVVVPVVYSLIDGTKNRVGRRWNALWQRRKTVTKEG